MKKAPAHYSTLYNLVLPGGSSTGVALGVGGSGNMDQVSHRDCPYRLDQKRLGSASDGVGLVSSSLFLGFWS